MKKGLVPVLRFPEFRDIGEWNKKNLGELAIFLKGKGLPKSAITRNGKNLCVHYGELFTEYSEVIANIYSRTDLYDGCFFSVENDVLMPTSDVTPNGLAKACCIKFDGVILGGDILIIRTDKTEINGEFISRQIRHLEQKVLQLVSGSTVFHLYASSIKKLALRIPSLKEQKKIADCLSSIDELVTAQTQKLEALKAHKKGLMQQLFPAEGETVPKLRFPEFQDAGEWEEVSVESCFEHIRNGFVGTATPYYVSDGIHYLQGKNIKQGQIDSTGLVFVSNEFHQKQKKSQLNANDILMVQSGHVGECALVSKRFIGSNCHALIVMSPKKIIHSAFIKNFFYSPIGKQRINEIKTGNTIEHILVSDLKLLKLTLPSIFEQQKIANCLSSIDELITAQTQKLAALKAHKKGLMQQLFPNTETEHTP